MTPEQAEASAREWIATLLRFNDGRRTWGEALHCAPVQHLWACKRDWSGSDQRALCGSGQIASVGGRPSRRAAQATVTANC
jgi:hypothetical protein